MGVVMCARLHTITVSKADNRLFEISVKQWKSIHQAIGMFLVTGEPGWMSSGITYKLTHKTDPMFRKNITIAYRSLRKDPFYAISNLAGLTIGITSCLLILSFVTYELSFDDGVVSVDKDEGSYLSGKL